MKGTLRWWVTDSSRAVFPSDKDLLYPEETAR